MTDHKEYIFHCECHDDHFMVLDWYADDPYPDFSVGSSLHIGGNFFTTLPRRIEQAWRLIKKGHVDTYAGIILTEENVVKLRTALDEYVADWKASEGKRSKLRDAVVPGNE